MGWSGDDDRELWIVRRRLERLAWLRLTQQLSGDEEQQYRALVVCELRLLSRRPVVAAP